MGTQQFCLRWNHHQNNMMAVFEQLLSNEALVDVTLACEGLSLKAHKTILSACSPFFQSLFLENPCKHPIVILKDIKYCDLKAIVEFMYRGEVNVTQDQLSALLKIAETLQVKGLAEIANSNQQTEDTLMDTISPHQFSNIPPSEPPVQPKRTLPQSNNKRRVRNRKRSNSGSVQNENIDCGSTRIKEQPDSPEIIDDPAADILSDTSSQENTSLDISQQPVHSHCSSFDNVNREQILPVENSHLTSLQTDYCRNPKLSKGDVYDMEPYKLMEQSMTTESVPLLTQEQLSSPILNQMTASTSSHEQSISSLQTNIQSKCQSIGSVSSTPSQPTFNNEISQERLQKKSKTKRNTSEKTSFRGCIKNKAKNSLIKKRYMEEQYEKVLSDEQRAHQRELARQRMRRYRERLKSRIVKK